MWRHYITATLYGQPAAPRSGPGLALAIPWVPQLGVFFALRLDNSFSFYYLALAVPFFTASLSIGALLCGLPKVSNRIYAANLIGSAAGCILAPFALAAVGGLFLVGMLGGTAGMGWIFGAVVPSFALLLFLGGMVAKVWG